MEEKIERGVENLAANYVLGMLVENSTGFDTINGRRIWNVDFDAFEHQLVDYFKKLGFK